MAITWGATLKLNVQALKEAGVVKPYTHVKCYDAGRIFWWTRTPRETIWPYGVNALTKEIAFPAGDPAYEAVNRWVRR